ncbi:hypothetical protein BGZ63DRAFT_378816 [Mariannaea sp. PMI_226]|nr:hypothetical protein BGZ63DRAFT_378816 [Mariannaea sp. PMI_226]
MPFEVFIIMTVVCVDGYPIPRLIKMEALRMTKPAKRPVYEVKSNCMTVEDAGSYRCIKPQTNLPHLLLVGPSPTKHMKPFSRQITLCNGTAVVETSKRPKRRYRSQPDLCSGGSQGLGVLGSRVTIVARGHPVLCWLASESGDFRPLS